FRDYDDVRQKYIGGKVDVYVQGGATEQVTEQFAQSAGLIRDLRFRLDSAPPLLEFIADDSRLSPSTPIIELLGQTPLQQAQGLGLRNFTTGQSFNLANAVIQDF